MGWISDRKLSTGHHLSHGAKVGRRAGLLRKIVGEIEVNGLWYEKLECGHKGRLWSSVGNGGLFGIQMADSRKCLECREKAKKH